jgi:hypothetical protein
VGRLCWTELGQEIDGAMEEARAQAIRPPELIDIKFAQRAVA